MQIYDGTATNFVGKDDGNTKQDNALGSQGSSCKNDYIDSMRIKAGAKF